MALSRNEKAARRTRSQGFQPRAESTGWTGIYSGFSRPKVVGVSDVVKQSNRSLAQRAKRAEREWLRTLPKGVKI